MTSPTAHRPRLVALRGQLGLKLLDGPDADAVKLRELDDANAGLEIGDDGRGLVGWNGRAAEPHAAGAGASLAGKDTFADHLAFKFSEHARHLQQRLSARSCRIDGLRVKVEADAVSLKSTMNVATSASDLPNRSTLHAATTSNFRRAAS